MHVFRVVPAGVFVVQQIVYGDDECRKERRDLALGNVRLELVRHKIEGRSSRQRSQHARNDADDQRRPKHDLYSAVPSDFLVNLIYYIKKRGAVNTFSKIRTRRKLSLPSVCAGSRGRYYILYNACASATTGAQISEKARKK